jgi:hypothetical protein
MPLYSVLARDYFGQRIMGTVLGAATMVSSFGMRRADRRRLDLRHPWQLSLALRVVAVIGLAAVTMALAFPPQEAGIGGGTCRPPDRPPQSSRRGAPAPARPLDAIGIMRHPAMSRHAMPTAAGQSRASPGDRAGRVRRRTRSTLRAKSASAISPVPAAGNVELVPALAGCRPAESWSGVQLSDKRSFADCGAA